MLLVVMFVSVVVVVLRRSVSMIFVHTADVDVPTNTVSRPGGEAAARKGRCRREHKRDSECG
jgi:hypothetical protein